VAFGEHSNITNLGRCAFHYCSALKNITLSDKLEIIEMKAFSKCTSLKRVVYNKSLKTIGELSFQHSPKLEDFQLTSSSISSGNVPFAGCDRLIEIAVAAGFPSNTFSTIGGEQYNHGDGVVPYLRKRAERKGIILLAHLRFSAAVHEYEGSEVEKFDNARNAYADKFAGGLLQYSLIGGGPKGVLGEILSYV